MVYCSKSELTREPLLRNNDIFNFEGDLAGAGGVGCSVEQATKKSRENIVKKCFIPGKLPQID